MKQIIAMGGGGFSMEPDNPLLDTYVLQQSGKRNPKICFLPTASGDSETYIQRFYEFFEKMPCQPTHLSLLRPTIADLESFVLEQDILYVGGGNTKNLIALWRAWDLDRIVRQAWEQGTVLAGLSAGAICWFEQGSTDSYPGRLDVLPCLGFLPGICSPHYDGEAERRPSFHRMLAEGELHNGFAADDGAAMHFIGTELHRVISSRPHAQAYSVRKIGDQVVEEAFETVYLGQDQ